MPSATTISEALDTLPSSATFPPSSHHKPTRRLLLTTKKPKFDSSTSAETHRPETLKWVPSHPQHLLSHDAWRKGILNSRVKETILIAGRDAGVKQSLKFKCRLPLPFLEQNGPHDEDIIDNTLSEEGNDEEGLSGEEATQGLGLTASDLEADVEMEGAGMTIDLLENDDPSPSSPPSPLFDSTSTASPAAKRRRISRDDTKTQENYDSLPKDFLELLKSEVPGGRANVSPGEFARVWKMSGRRMGNELVLAQNEYFDKARVKEARKEGKRGGK
ncbi:hypothetical protein AOL_s00080g241 [Orbilia oligospora ATCC 24927]|uniref:Uncharacterized protein n=1 Tax=Arthrobotrys oligospora (strain ATCC 24927 / CBS 115.81 / DSM 1491) TaxID=756982 RepID=G1XEK6_ARTOA|nr:hypothetical protein AOL_s00080g241 [Orbilia oligospora ATCC 24927]EGX48612.1 hypothetical protein AOL_s00080g241 [Orbilia oligospora ATCC 24927]